MFKFNEAISFQINCDDQEEVDYYWSKLSEGGDETAQQCGWLKDKYGVSWQVVPVVLMEMLNDRDKQKAKKVMKAMLQMKKIDIRKLKRAYITRRNSSLSSYGKVGEDRLSWGRQAICNKWKAIEKE